MEPALPAVIFSKTLPQPTNKVKADKTATMPLGLEVKNVSFERTKIPPYDALIDNFRINIKYLRLYDDFPQVTPRN
jgi:hypothetical protein